MEDIVKRREHALEMLDMIGRDTPEDEIESLRAQLAEVTRERDQFEATCKLGLEYQAALKAEHREQLLATQAHAARLKEALEDTLQTLCWQCFGECRNITPRRILEPNEAEIKARAALSTPINLDALHELQGNAARWQYARQFLAVEDVEAWAGPEWAGHQPNEEESSKADAAVDRARKEQK